jgi:CRISPR-associated protein Cas6
MQTIDLSFDLAGDTIPADHGYMLYSALSRQVPEIHSEAILPRLAIHPIAGTPIGSRLLKVGSSSSLVFRLEEGALDLGRLAGSEIEIGEHRLKLGVIRRQALKPAAQLYSRLVVIKGAQDESSFLESANRQLKNLGIRAGAGLIRRTALQSREGKTSVNRSPFIRRTLRICDREIVGYAVMVEGLTAEESIQLQEVGLGGRRHFGCGVFVPAR